MKKNFFKRLITRYVNGTISDSHKEILDSYFSDKQIRANQAISDDGLRERIFDGINRKIVLAGQEKSGLKRYYRVAAAIIILALSALLIFKLNENPADNNHYLTFVTKNGQKKKIMLPDGSVAVINSASTIRYLDGFAGKLRKVDLEGEAYFDVAHDSGKPFIVHTKKIDVKVLGTLFNVKAYEGERIETSLIRGSVQVFIPSARKALATLKPNQKFVLGAGIESTASRELIVKGRGFVVTAPLLPVPTLKAVEWVRNRLSFDDQGFKEVVSLLERWYDVKITIQNPELLNYRFTGTFNDTGLIDILEALKASQDFNYRKEGNQINIY
jgi:transmembrane sensor